MHAVNRAIVAAVAVLLALVPAAASAGQLGVKDEPEVTGPLQADPELRGCNTRRERTETGEVFALFRICAQWYRFDPAADADEERDYGALWVQATVQSRNGWCTRQTKLETVLPQSGAHARGPRPGTTTKVSSAKKKTATKLTVDAQGATEEPGTVKQTYLIRKGTLRARYKADDRLYRVKWDGNTATRIALVKGVELSWPTGGQPPIPTPEILGRFRKGGC